MNNELDRRELAIEIAQLLDGLSVSQASEILELAGAMIRERSVVCIHPPCVST